MLSSCGDRRAVMKSILRFGAIVQNTCFEKTLCRNALWQFILIGLINHPKPVLLKYSGFIYLAMA